MHRARSIPLPAGVAAARNLREALIVVRLAETPEETPPVPGPPPGEKPPMPGHEPIQDPPRPDSPPGVPPQEPPPGDARRLHQPERRFA